MRTLLFLLAIITSASAQTLKWDHTSADPAFPHDGKNLWHLRGDAAGNVAFSVQYFQNVGGPNGVQICWISAAGKVLNADIITGAGVQDARIVSVSPACLVVQFYQNGGQVIRKYTRRGSVVAFKDTPIGGNYIAFDPAFEMTDKLGFFVVKQDQSAHFQGIQRFTIR